MMHALSHLDPTIRPGQTIDRYIVEQVLGEGGAAIVYLVRHSRLDTLYALKLLHKRSKPLTQRLLREAKVQSTLHHPHIVHVIDVIEHEGQPGVVMEFVDGPSLEQMMLHRRLDLAQVDRLAEHMLSAIERAHRQGIIHRDLKPANVLLCPKGGSLIAKVCDFGLAKSLGHGGTSSTRTGCTLGTPQYMSPEQIRDSKRVDERTDVYALGTMFYEMLTGTHPFAEKRDAWVTLKNISEGTYTPLNELLPHAPERMSLAIHAALQPDPDQRCASITAFRALWNGDSQPFLLGWEDDLIVTANQLSPTRRHSLEIGSNHPTVYPASQTPTLVIGEQPASTVRISTLLIAILVAGSLPLGVVLAVAIVKLWL